MMKALSEKTFPTFGTAKLLCASIVAVSVWIFVSVQRCQEGLAVYAGMKVQAWLLWATDLHHVGHRTDKVLPGPPTSFN